MGELGCLRPSIPLDVERRKVGATKGGLEDHGEFFDRANGTKLTLQIWVFIMFAALNIDRSNIQNAVSDNMLDDLGITQSDYVSSPSRSISPRHSELGNFSQI